MTKIRESLDPIVSMGGLPISPDVLLQDVELKDGDLLLLPGSNAWFEDDHSAVMRLALDAMDRGIHVAAICGATIALARHGALNQRPHTSNDLGFLKTMVPDYSGEDLYKEEAAMSAANLITAGGLAPLEFSREVLKVLDVMKADTLDLWYRLYKTQDGSLFPALMQSLG